MINERLGFSEHSACTCVPEITTPAIIYENVYKCIGWGNGVIWFQQVAFNQEMMSITMNMFFVHIYFSKCWGL